MLRAAIATTASALTLLSFQAPVTAAVVSEGKIVFSNKCDVFIVKPDGSGRTNLTKNGYTTCDADPSISPDGKRVVFQSDKDHPGYTDIFTIASSGGTWTRLTKDKKFDNAPAWSPTGKRIAWSRGIGAPRQFDIFTMRADGSDKTNVTNDPAAAYDIQPAWSSDGTRIAYSSDRDNYGCNDGPLFIAFNQIYVISSQGKNRRQVFDDPKMTAAAPDWFGSKIVFAGDKYELTGPPGNPDCGTHSGDYIYKVPSAGGGRTKLVRGNYPSWSTTGKKIAFAGGTLSRPTLRKMNADGTNKQKITDGGTFPDWKTSPA
jgi:Tol biopolymer transport system component